MGFKITSKNFAALADFLANKIEKTGAITFSDFIEICLYDPEYGFYTKNGAPGRRGDFLTSPEVGPLFGSLLANWLDEVWSKLGKPKDFVVIEVGAGRGTLARSIKSAKPLCLIEGKYVMVERSEVLRKEQPTSPNFVSTSKMPESPFNGAVIANELLDNFPFDLLAVDQNCWREVCVGKDKNFFLEVLGKVRKAPRGVPLIPNSRIPIQYESSKWVKNTLKMLFSGSLLVIDYASTTEEMSKRPQDSWLRTYCKHKNGGPLLENPGGQDITVEVAIDQLPIGATICTQREFLEKHGIADLVNEGRKTWNDRSSIGDLKAVKARSRIIEAEALIDLEGLGNFTVLEWSVGY